MRKWGRLGGGNGKDKSDKSDLASETMQVERGDAGGASWEPP